MKINLMNYKKRITSQHGENGILNTAIRYLKIKKGIAVDVGAHDGYVNSNTYPLLSYGWKLFLFEKDKNLYNKLIKNIKNQETKNVSINLEENNLNTILKSYNIPHNFDLLSIDIDSDDYWIWKDLRYKPKIVIIEYEGSLRGNKVYPYNTTNRIKRASASASGESLVELGKEKGYSLVGITRGNLIFIRDDLIGDIETINFDNYKSLLHKNIDYDSIDEEWRELGYE